MWRRILWWWRREQENTDLDEELRAHLAIEARERMGPGTSLEDAEFAARRAFGNRTRIAEETRDVWRIVWLDELWRDARYGVRTLGRNLGFAVLATLTLALGIGANTAIFSFLEGVVLAPLPYTQPDRLVVVWQSNSRAPRLLVSGPDFRAWQTDARVFEQIVALGWQSYDLSSPGAPEHLAGKEISSGFFSTLGVQLALGRDFSPQEDQQGGARVAIISARLWRDRFARSLEVLGQVITLDGVSYTIVGVVPSWFNLHGDADVHTPLGQKDSLILDDRGLHPFLCIARLKPGMTITQAQADIGTVQSNLNQIHPDTNRGLGTVIVPLKEGIVEGADDVLLLLLGAVGLVLLIACANVANVLLARSAARTREFGIRLALGASRIRIIRQLITESLLLSLAGGGFGLALAHWGVRPILTAASVSLPRNENIAVNTTVLLFTVCVSIFVGVLFGLAPALKSSKPDLEASLKGGSRGSTKGRHRTEDMLVIAQVALAAVLLVGAGLFFRTVWQLWHVNPGFDARNILTFRVALSPSVTKTPSSTRIAYQQLIERVRQIPGVQAVDFTTLVPLSRLSNTGAFWLGSQEPTSIAEAPRAVFQQVGPDYLRVMRLPLLQGRFFSSEDTTESANVVVIDSVLARTYFPEGSPVGETMTINLWGPARIVGVVGHVKHWGLGNTDDLPQNQIYMSFNQLPDPWVPMFNRNLTALVRTPLATSAVLPAIKTVVYGPKSDQPVHSVRSMEQFVYRVDGCATISHDLVGNVCEFGIAAGKHRDLRCDLLFGHATRARNWDSYGSRCSKA